MWPGLPTGLDPAVRAETVSAAEDSANQPSGEDAIDHTLQICPTCGHRLQGHRCKLVCTHCGYYMSCADYY